MLFKCVFSSQYKSNLTSTVFHKRTKVDTQWCKRRLLLSESIGSAHHHGMELFYHCFTCTSLKPEVWVKLRSSHSKCLEKTQ